MLSVNGTAVQKHQLKGPAGYTVVGSPTITDGVASGFTTSNYLTLPVANLSQPFEIMLKIRTPQTWGSNWDALLSSIETIGFAIAKRGSNRGLAYYVPNESGTARTQVDGAYTMLSNTNYYIRIRFTGTALIIDRSTDKENWVVEYQTARTVGAFSSAYSIGLNARAGAQPWTGSIDLNETYIKINGKLWFYQPQETKYIVKDGKLVWADPRIALSGPVNYTVNGSPTITDGVASGFSNNNYIKIPQLNIPDRYEIYTSFVISNIQDANIIGEWTWYVNGIFLAYNKISARCYFGSYNTITSDITVSTNTRYFVKYVRDIQALTHTLSVKTETSDWVVNQGSFEITQSPSTYNFRIGAGNTGVFDGSIDLKATYIKVNDQLWFYGKNYATQNIATVPVGYTFGTTTTPSIGYVDMRTQEFTAAPSGATIGRYE